MKHYLGGLVLSVTLVMADTGFSPKHDSRMRQVMEAALSPDSRKVAYTLSVPRDLTKDKNGPAYRELHVVDRRGRSRPFVTGPVSVGNIAWSPDHKTVTYLAKRGEDKHTALYGIPVDGGESQKMFEHETGISSYHWSHQPNRFLFVATEKAPENPAKDQGFDAEIYEEELRRGQLWIASRDGAEDEWETELLELEGSVYDAQWSLDGRRIAVGIAPKPLIDHFFMYQKLKVVDVASGKVVSVADHEGKLGPFRWSPDGERLALIGGAHMNDPSPGRLFVVTAADGTTQRMAPDYLPDFAAAEWVDDERLQFIADAGCLTDYGRLSVATGEMELSAYRAAPVAATLSLIPATGHFAVVASTPDHGYEAFLGNGQSRKLRRLTDSNPWLKDVSLARQEIVTYEARDGVKIEGVLLYPLNYQRGQRYPLIMVVHGGPETRVPHGWVTNYSRPGQFAAAAGYFAFYPNYRGSTGRGIEFAMSHQADYAGKEFNDLVDAIDHLADAGLVDPDKVGVTGGSYGGYASAWCATYHTERFAASVMFVGISDLISKQGTTDIPDEMYLVHARKYPWNDWPFFLERSPIYHIEKARTPILILHGKDDPRVHPSQSMELYRSLKIIGKTPVRLVWYPNEGHGNRRAAARYDYSLRLMRWMDHYLKGPGGDPPAPELEYGIDEEKPEQPETE